ncbi:HLH domain-containing protein [Cephalotus follicularis]|uniref:HLH domain-containing protein n=1 Tax=Cephalotus follicularis TaxID=3775 RepID=A0A1Q3BV34_CEPFO|nr:HLH domain-containing protein [Cephalotus follicularis]
MDQCDKNGLGPSTSTSAAHDTRQEPEVEEKDPIVSRRVQKADREKLRRDRLNELFLELGNRIEIPNNDKATILTDTIQLLKDLTSEVNRLKAEFVALSEESTELTQEKHEHREEKASLKSDIENLNGQYQQTLRVMFPWADITGPPYAYPIPIPVPPGPIPMHTPLQSFPFFVNRNPSPCSTAIFFSSPSNPPSETTSDQYASTSHISSKQHSRSKSVDNQTVKNSDACYDSDDVATDLELKMPGSSEQ